MEEYVWTTTLHLWPSGSEQYQCLHCIHTSILIQVTVTFDNSCCSEQSTLYVMLVERKHASVGIGVAVTHSNLYITTHHNHLTKSLKHSRVYIVSLGTGTRTIDNWTSCYTRCILIQIAPYTHFFIRVAGHHSQPLPQGSLLVRWTVCQFKSWATYQTIKASATENWSD